MPPDLHKQPQHTRRPTRQRRPLWDRFWAKVRIPAVPDSHLVCWLWVGGKTRRRNSSGWKGKIAEGGKRGKTLNAARVALELCVGPPPSPAHEAGHTCPDYENSLCVNPGHLEWQTRVENERQKSKYRTRDSV